MPLVLASIAPTLEARLQYSPVASGANSDTRLSADDYPTSS